MQLALWSGRYFCVVCENMSKLIIRFLAVVLGLFVAAKFVNGVSVDSIYAASIVAVFLGLMNLTVRPVLVLFTLPITILTLGLFIFILNGLLFFFVGTIVKGFEVAGFWPAVLGSIVVSLISWLVQKIT